MNAIKTIFLKEIKIEFRNKQMINNYLLLAVLIIASFRFVFTAIDTPIDFSVKFIASPILWITFFFSGMFSLSPTYKREIDQGTRDGLLLAPISPSSIYFGKLLSNFLIIFCLELFTVFLFFVFFSLQTPDLLALFSIIIVGTIGFVALGNIISAISSNLSQSEVMLPVLLVPILLFTVVMSAVGATSKIFAGANLFGVMQEVRFILLFDIVFLAVGYLLIDYILGD